MRCSFLFSFIFVGITCALYFLGMSSFFSFDVLWGFYWENVLYIIVVSIFLAACLSRSKISSIVERWKSFLFSVLVIFLVVFAWDQSGDSEQIQEYLRGRSEQPASVASVARGQVLSGSNTIVRSLDGESRGIVLVLFYLFVTLSIASAILVVNMISLGFVRIVALVQWLYLTFFFMNFFTRDRALFFLGCLIVLFVYFVLIRVNVLVNKRERVMRETVAS